MFGERCITGGKDAIMMTKTQLLLWLGWFLLFLFFFFFGRVINDEVFGWRNYLVSSFCVFNVQFEEF